MGKRAMIGGGEDVSPLEIRASGNRLKVNESALMGIPERKRGLPLYQAATPLFCPECPGYPVSRS